MGNTEHARCIAVVHDALKPLAPRERARVLDCVAEKLAGAPSNAMALLVPTRKPKGKVASHE